MKPLQVSPQLRGHHVVCPHCGSSFLSPPPPPVQPPTPSQVELSRPTEWPTAVAPVALQIGPIVRMTNALRKAKQLPIALIVSLVGAALFVGFGCMAAIVLSLVSTPDQAAGRGARAENSLESKFIAVQKQVAGAEVSPPSSEQADESAATAESDNRFHGPDDGLRRAVMARFSMPRIVLAIAVAEATGVPQSRQQFEENVLVLTLHPRAQLVERIQSDFAKGDVEDILGAYALYLAEARLWLEFEEYEADFLDQANASSRDKHRILAIYAEYRQIMSKECQERADLILRTALVGVP